MINPIYSIPLPPISHPLLERLIGSVRRGYLDRLFFWNTRDLQDKLDQFRDYFNEHRVHAGIDGDLPNRRADEIEPGIASLENYSWEPLCNGLFDMPKATRLTIRAEHDCLGVPGFLPSRRFRLEELCVHFSIPSVEL